MVSKICLEGCKIRDESFYEDTIIIIVIEFRHRWRYNTLMCFNFKLNILVNYLTGLGCSKWTSIIFKLNYILILFNRKIFASIALNRKYSNF